MREVGRDPTAERPSIRRLSRSWPLGFVALLAAAAFISPGDPGASASAVAPNAVARLATPDRSRVDQLRAVIELLPSGANALVGMDADLGTYPEIRPAVRAIFADLLGRGVALSIVSFTAEGRAIAIAEFDRLRRGQVSDAALLDLGFIAGAEAGMVRAATSVVRPGAAGPVADSIRASGGGIAAFNLVLVVGGGDIGPRSWVEQIGSRLPNLPMIAVAPTFLEPELQPYLRTGQLRALLATVRDDAAYVDAVAGAGVITPGSRRDGPPSALAMLIGMVIALVVLIQAAASGVIGSLRAGLAARTR
jgi:hypothetical protein